MEGFRNPRKPRCSRSMQDYVRTLLIVLVLIQPAVAWGRSEQHNSNYGQRERLRLRWKRELERIDKLRRNPTYPYFQLDVF